MKTTVVHCQKSPYDVYIGRGKGSKWGNPFSHREGTLANFKVRTRKEAIDRFEEYLLNNEELMKSLPELKGKVLGCWCKDSRKFVSCHGDILAKHANALDRSLF